MAGFFTKKQTQSKVRPDGKKLSCYSCGLFRDVISPKMEPYGRFKKKIMVIGTSPDFEDDKRGKPLQGKGGKLLSKTFRKFKINTLEDCVVLNSVNCRPISSKSNFNRKPTNFEIDCCRQQIVLRAIQKYKPKVIILLGIQAVYSVIGNRWKKDLGKIDKWRGWNIPDQDYKAWICPIFDTKFILKKDSKEVVNLWEEDIERALSLHNKIIPINKEPTIHYLKDLRPLNKLNQSNVNLLTFDYETTGLKPHKKEHEIVCASVAISTDEVYTFKMPKKRRDRMPFIRLLRNKYIKKMAHQIKFEENWSKEILKTNVQNWYWDSLLAAHILDPRSGITSLKFQNYVLFGVVDYDSEIAPYLTAIDEKDGNSLNRVKELLKTEKGTKNLLKYCAYDSIIEFKLAIYQQKLLGYE
ncbi:MAG: uracil-DNA glycosylase family protein [bacterium]